MKIDKQNGTVAFNDQEHIYWNVNDNKRYVSVTTLIHRYTQEFDKEFWSSYKALEKLLPKKSWEIEKKSLLNTKKFNKELLSLYDIDENDFNAVQQDILDAWDEENRKSCERGTKIHSEIENSFYDHPTDISLRKFGLGGKFECKKDYSELDLEHGVYPEYLIYRESDDGILRIAGQVDLIIKSGNEITIVDHKGLPLDTEIPTEDGWTTMKDLQVGNKVFDKDGNLCNVIVKSNIHYNPCYTINFSKDFSITADCDHRWLVYFSTHPNTKYHGKPREKIMTTKELYEYLQTYNPKNQYQIPKIQLNRALNLGEKNLPIDPYILGLWLGDGTASCGQITQELNSKAWNIIKNKGYEISKNQEKREGVHAERKTVYGLMTLLKQNNLLNNKHIPEIYQRGSIEQRIALIRGLMDADGFYSKSNGRFIMSTTHKWQSDGLIKLLASLGIKASENIVVRSNGYKENTTYYDVKFDTNLFNPFLCRNQDVIGKETKNQYWSIKSVVPTKTIPTQCIMVDSPSHTYLCTKHMLVTHNTNKEIKTKGTYNTATRSTYNMKYPLNNLPDVNFYHYTLQLSTYAWMLQKINPNFIIKDLILNHYDHNGNNTLYHCEYLKHDVEKMLYHYKKSLILEQKRSTRKRIEY